MKPTIECTRIKACRWQGNNSDLVEKINKRETKKHGIEIIDLKCPKCGCKTTYDIED